MADLAAAIKAAEEFFAQYDPTVYGLTERGSIDTKEVRLLRSLLAAAHEAEKAHAEYRSEHEGCIDLWRKECTAAQADRDAARVRAAERGEKEKERG